MDQDLDYIRRELSKKLGKAFDELPKAVQSRMTANTFFVLSHVAKDGKGMSKIRGDDYIHRLFLAHQRNGILTKDPFSISELLEAIGYQPPLPKHEDEPARRKLTWRASKLRAEYRKDHPPKTSER